MLSIMVKPGAVYTLIPLGVVLLGVITFEIAMAVTISTLPRSRFKQKWTDAERSRVLRVFCFVFFLWPTVAAVILTHVYGALWLALCVDLLAMAMIYLCIRWLMQNIRQRRLIMEGHCTNCLYDLQASQHSDHCPECGTELADHPVWGRKAPNT